MLQRSASSGSNRSLLVGPPQAGSPRTPSGAAAGTATTDQHERLLQVLGRVLQRFDGSPAFGSEELTSDARISTLAQLRSFVHGHEDATIEPPVLCRLARILRDDAQPEPAAILYLQQIAELSHNHDYGHVSGKHGAVSEHDMLEMISSHVELCGLVKGRTQLRHADEALRLSAAVAGQQKGGDLPTISTRLTELAARLRELSMAGQAARMLQQVARIDTAINAQQQTITTQPWSKSNSRIPHTKTPRLKPGEGAGKMRLPGKMTPGGGYAPSADLVAGSAEDGTMGAYGQSVAADRHALLRATSDMKEVLGLTQRVAELERLLSNSESRANAAEAMAYAEVSAAKAVQAASKEMQVYAVQELAVDRALARAEARGRLRVSCTAFGAWAGGVQVGLRDQAEAEAEAATRRAAAAEARLISARQQIWTTEQEQVAVARTSDRLEEVSYNVQHLMNSLVRLLKRRYKTQWSSENTRNPPQLYHPIEVGSGNQQELHGVWRMVKQLYGGGSNHSLLVT